MLPRMLEGIHMDGFPDAFQSSTTRLSLTVDNVKSRTFSKPENLSELLKLFVESEVFLSGKLPQSEQIRDEEKKIAFTKI